MPSRPCCPAGPLAPCGWVLPGLWLVLVVDFCLLGSGKVGFCAASPPGACCVHWPVPPTVWRRGSGQKMACPLVLFICQISGAVQGWMESWDPGPGLHSGQVKRLMLTAGPPAPLPKGGCLRKCVFTLSYSSQQKAFMHSRSWASSHLHFHLFSSISDGSHN